MSFKIPIAVYIVWHPDYLDGQQMADSLYSTLCRDTKKPLVRSIGIPVYFRCINSSVNSFPIDIDYNESEYTAIVPLITSHFILDDNYKEYLERIQSECNNSKTRRIFPVSLNKDAYRISKSLSIINFIRAHNIPEAVTTDLVLSQTAYINSCLLHEFCRLLMNMKPASEEQDSIGNFATAPVKLFISHSKHDESILDAKNFKKFIEENTQLKTFFDANDIGYGYNFGEEIKKAAKTSALIVFQSDSYSDREWCRIEIITAKSAECPVVIVNNVQKGEKRTFPYLGNYPSIRLTDNFQEIIDTTLEQVLFNLFTKMLLAKQAHLFNLDPDFILSNYPELFNFIELKKKLKTKGITSSVVIYPDPPLGSEEINILNEMDENYYFVTPIMLSTIIT